MTIDLDALEAAAKAATPGPWKNVDTPAMSVCDEIHDANGTRIAMALTTRHPRDGEQFIDFDQAEVNAAYIAAVSPDVVLELIAELRAKNDLLEEIFDDCWVKDSGACPVCHTYTHKHWCWYPQLAKTLGKPLDEYDERFLAYLQKYESLK